MCLRKCFGALLKATSSQSVRLCSVLKNTDSLNWLTQLPMWIFISTTNLSHVWKKAYRTNYNKK